MATMTWREYRAAYKTMTESELAHALDEERAGQKRKDVLEMLHQRYCKLRAARERAAIMAECHTT